MLYSETGRANDGDLYKGKTRFRKLCDVEERDNAGQPQRLFMIVKRA